MKPTTITGKVVGENTIRIDKEDITCWKNSMQEAVAPQPLILSKFINKEVMVGGMLQGSLFGAYILSPKNIISKILKLYNNTEIHELLNNVVAIGTWPTPENPANKPLHKFRQSGSVSIDSVPLPERTIKLKKLLSCLITVSSKNNIKEIFPEQSIFK